MKTNRLREIDIIRTFVIIVLVAFHAFAPYSNGWVMPISPGKEYTVYHWISKFLYSGMLETFVFISGYVYALGNTLKNPSTMDLVHSKLKRLYMPCIFWGVIFFLIFYDSSKLFTLNTLYLVGNGIAHLWFLPMLFWCFILEKAIIWKIGLNMIWILFILAILPYPTLPFRIGISMYYILFFHLGYVVFQNRANFQKKCNFSGYYVYAFILFYILLFCLSLVIQHNFVISPTLDLFSKAIYVAVGNVCRIICSTFAVAIYYYIGLQISRSKLGENIFFHKVALFSFGIYIFQEILLRLIYYKTAFCSILTNIYYPWVALLLVFAVSYILSLCLKHIPYLNKLV